ncbi:MAG: FAD-dependent oxidoreductase [Rhabdochlamydiaceae bacterium]|jgi:thioredoxin reductase (NADPH)
MKKFILWINFLILSFTSPLCAEVVEEEYPVVILGGGVAALTSATYLARAGITPVVITGPYIGGTITQSHNVQNWPGEISIAGIELGDRVRKQAEQNGAILAAEVVTSVDLSKRPFLITTKAIFGEQVKKYKAQSVIIALGAMPNLLNVPGEKGGDGYWSRGVYSCAVCDGSLYKDKVVAVVGGGDSALIEAQYLSNIAEKVHVFVRRNEFRTVEKERMKEVLSRPNVEVHFKTVIERIEGDGQKVTHLIVRDGKTRSEVPVDALFLAIGSRPNTTLFQNQLELDPEGYIVLKKHQMTSLDGVYAIGDVSDREFKQAVSAAGDGAKAALQAQQYLVSYTPPAKVEGLGVVEKKGEPKKVIEITSKKHFEKELQESQGPVFIDFYATYCGPCRMFSPVYDAWAKEYGNKIKFLKVNSAIGREIFEKYQVSAIPTLIILDERGNVIRRSTGFKEISDVEKYLEKMDSKTEFSFQDFN